MKAQRKDQLKVAEQAARWLVRLEEDGGIECRTEFVAWIKHSPRHLEELLLTAATYARLDRLDPQRQVDVARLLADSGAEVVALEGAEDPTVLPSEFTPGRSSRLRVRRWRWIAGVAAGVVGMALLTAIGLTRFGDAGGEHYSTAVGEQRSVRLADGSIVYLNTRSSIAVDFSAHSRDVRLRTGEALFVVAQDAARPFRVRTGSAFIQAVGTQFNVYERRNGTTVSVIEGRVRVGPQARPAAANQLLAAGEEAEVSRQDVVKRAAPDLAHTTAWRQRQFVFSSDTLADVAEQVNRYNSTQIRIADPAVAQRRLSGIFNVDDVDALLAFLNGEGDLEFERHGSELIVRQSSARDGSR